MEISRNCESPIGHNRPETTDRWQIDQKLDSRYSSIKNTPTK